MQKSYFGGDVVDGDIIVVADVEFGSDVENNDADVGYMELVNFGHDADETGGVGGTVV